MKRILHSKLFGSTFLSLILLFVLFFLVNDVVLPWYVNRGGIIEVPSVIGRGFEEAVLALDSAGLDGRRGDTRPDRDRPAEVVILQNPLAGDFVKHGRRIYLTISGGEQLVTVPNVRGRTIRDARFALEREGLKAGVLDYQPSDQFPQNTVMDQSPAAGTQAKKERHVSLVISQGAVAGKIAVPDVGGKPLTEASTILTASGLAVGNIKYLASDELLPNTVVEQFPRAGELVERGQAIDLFVVQGGQKKKEYFEY